MFTYKSTKIGHDIRLGFSILGKSLENIYEDVPRFSSASHLSYLLPAISFLCSLLKKDIAWDKRALFWSVVNGLQCFVVLLGSSKELTIAAYALDIGFSYRVDRDWLIEQDNNAANSKVNLVSYPETIYALLILGVIIADVMDRTDIGLPLFAFSLLIKLWPLMRDRQFTFSYNTVLSALITSFAPIGLFFASKNDYSLVFVLGMLTTVVYLMNEQFKPINSPRVNPLDKTDKQVPMPDLEKGLEPTNMIATP